MIYVHDVARMASFYSEILGASRIDGGETGEWTELGIGEGRLWIHLVGSEWRDERGVTAPVEVREQSAVKLVISLPPEGRIDKRVQELGGFVIERPWGSDFCDPEGNVFSVQFGSAT